MLQFVQSISLWASAGIIVPVVIHLWNVKEGKTLQVGSIAFLTESAKSHAKSFKLSDLLLLLLRCLLIIVLAILIAKPFYEKQVDLHKEKGWVLIEKSQVDEAYKKFKPSIDSLIHAGFAFHYFNAGFKEARFDTVVKSVRDTGMDENISYWNLLKQLDQKIPSTLPVYLFTDNSLRRFTGARPDISLSLRWYVYASSDTLSTWVQNAYQISTDSIRVISGNSTPTITRFKKQTLSSKNATRQFSFKNTDGKTFVSYNDTSKTVCNNPVKIDTSTTVISIYQHGYDLDANYLNAALNAIKAFTKYRFRVSVVSDIRQIAHHCNWLFWLSEEKVPESLFKNNVFLYEKGKVENKHSSIITEDKSEATITEDLPLYRTIAGNYFDANTFPVWKDGFGRAVLSIEKKNATLYHFYSRFNPQWNGLPWSTQFPQIILDLIFNRTLSSAEINERDKRIIDATQIQPVITRDQSKQAKQDLFEKKELSKVFWIIAFVLFFLERIMASRTKKEAAYG